MLVLAIDPGVTTGIALARGVEANSRHFELVSAGEVKWDQRCQGFYDLLYGLIHEDEPLGAIVIESFVLYPNEAANQSYSDFPSVRVIGIVEAYAHLLGIAPLIVMQSAAQRKSAMILPEHYDQLTRSKHARDAYKHLRYFVIMQYQRTKQRARK